ncbi:MAG: hypothetical protein QM759_11465 [Terricaulis sp.]
MAKAKEKKAHLWERDKHDWYVEPYECSAALFAVEAFRGAIWDPACGVGRIVTEAQRAGLSAIGTDIVKRSDVCTLRCDFLKQQPDIKFSNIVSNPPFGVAEEFVQKSLTLVRSGGKVAMLLPLVWMAGFSAKRQWLPRSPLRRVFPLSPRPSMPPGAVIAAGETPGNGTKDFAWFLWQNGYSGTPEIVFLNTSAYKRQRRNKEEAQNEGRAERHQSDGRGRRNRKRDAAKG